MKNRNPFEVLGITPNMVRALEGRELFSLIKSSYRALQLIYHPDRSPLHDQNLKNQKTQKVAEINLAFEKLNLERDPDSLDHYRSLYIRRKGEGWKKILRQTNRQLAELHSRNELLSQGYLHHLLEPCFSDQQDFAGEHAAGFNLKNRRFGLQDIAINHNVHTISWDLGTNYKELKFDAEGRMFYKLPCRKRFIQVNFIKLLGAVDKDKIDLVPLMDRVVPQDLLIQKEKERKIYEDSQKGFDLLNSLTAEKFRRHCLPFLKTELTEGSYLFSLHRKTCQENRINLEGLIIRVHAG
jgi:curved DNA-binding protein CbpA